ACSRSGAGRAVVAGGRFLPVPRLRRGEAAADPAAGDALQGRLRRDVRRHPRRRVYASGIGAMQEAFLLIEKISRQVGKKLKSSHALLATAESCTGGWVAQAI